MYPSIMEESLHVCVHKAADKHLNLEFVLFKICHILLVILLMQWYTS